MNTWWLVLLSLSRSDSATTRLGKSGYQPWGVGRRASDGRQQPSKGLNG